MDKKAVTLLRKAGQNTLTGDQLDILRRSGMLWEPADMEHHTLVQKIHSLASRISLEKAVNGFLYSISSGDCRYRTALSSLLWARALPEHECEKKHSSWSNDYFCRVCGGVFSSEDDRTRLNMLEHSKYRLLPESKYMDVNCAGYVLNDLHAFLELPEVTYCDEDFRILNRILGLAKEISPTNKVNALLGLITADNSLDLTRANAYSILGVLSACGVFDTPEYQSYTSGFTNWDDLQFVYEPDMYYPLNLWRGKHGINYGAFAPVFGAEIAQRLTPQTAISGTAEREPQKKTASDLAAEEFFKGFEMPVQLDDRTRYYYGLAPIEPVWERVVQCKTVRGSYKHLVLYYEGNTIKKMIETTICSNGKPYSYLESDMNANTNNRKYLLPKTSRGREQTLTPSHLQTPTYMLGHLHVFANQIFSFNCSNDQQLPLPPADYEDFDGFSAYTERYIASCTEEYHEVLRNFRTNKRNTIRFTAGDIFRVQLTPTLYTYCLVLGALRDILRWKILPEEHPFHHAMTQPIIFRQYALITENGNMTTEELQQYPLLEAKYAQDNEIIWGTYPITDHKPLGEADVDFGFWISDRLQSVAWGLTYHRFDEDPCGIFGQKQTVPAFLCVNGLTGAQYMTCSVGVSIRAGLETGGFHAGVLPCPAPRNADTMHRLAEHFGFSPETAADEFAELFGGVTRKRFIELTELHRRK